MDVEVIEVLLEMRATHLKMAAEIKETLKEKGVYVDDLATGQRWWRDEAPE